MWSTENNDLQILEDRKNHFVIKQECDWLQKSPIILQKVLFPLASAFCLLLRPHLQYKFGALYN